MAEFINPYAFVPLPTKVDRAPAPSQERLRGGTLSGRIKVHFEADTPVSVGSDTLWGSSVAGAVRSLHETLTGSCLRIVDPDYVPAYRQPIETAPGREALALVRQRTDDSLLLSVFELADTIRVCSDALLAAASNNPDVIHTGLSWFRDGRFATSSTTGETAAGGLLNQRMVWVCFSAFLVSRRSLRDLLNHRVDVRDRLHNPGQERQWEDEDHAGGGGVAD